MRNKLIKFILSFTDYYKVKEENKELKKDINTLIEKPFSTDAYIIVERHNTGKLVDKCIWMGDFDTVETKFDGIFNKLSNKNN